MRATLIALAIVGTGLFVANEVTETIPVLVAGALWGGTVAVLFGCWQLSRKAWFRADPPPPPSGPPIAKAGWLSGVIGTTPAPLPIWLTVHTDRLVVRIPMVGHRTIMADQLGPISTHGTRRPKIQIEHRAPGLASPVTPWIRAHHPLRQALTELTRK